MDKITAIVLVGKNKGKIVEVLQWCNDWFSVNDEKNIYSPSALAFKSSDFDKITSHQNNGVMFGLYEPKIAPAWTGEYIYTLRKIRVYRKPL